ncbi:hypothetical protein AB3X94_29915 [Paraburkholderia sp. BR10923]|uniref:hypothetical protein n=1 Tax=Paraburkholderia sp. BR10923 TaxID=3236992 RepID=UPI0034CFD697
MAQASVRSPAMLRSDLGLFCHIEGIVDFNADGFQGTTAVRAIVSVATSSASASVINWARLLTDRFGGGVGNPFASFLIPLTWIAAARDLVLPPAVRCFAGLPDIRFAAGNGVIRALPTCRCRDWA